MTKKPTQDPTSLIQLIAIVGVVLDTYSVYGFYQKLNDQKYINETLQQAGLTGTEMGINEAILGMQRTVSLLLMLFLVFDFIAYYFLVDYRNWARKYALSIAMFYIVGCLFSFSWIFLIYGVFTIYILYKPHPEFLKS